MRKPITITVGCKVFTLAVEDYDRLNHDLASFGSALTKITAGGKVKRIDPSLIFRPTKRKRK